MSFVSSHQGAVSRRGAPRRRTRLRPVKLLAPGGAFLADGAAMDLSARGARVLTYGSAGVAALNDRFCLFDGIDQTIRPVIVAWERAGTCGMRFTGPPRRACRAEIMRLTGRYYAVAD